jgi:hypothetical protein
MMKKSDMLDNPARRSGSNAPYYERYSCPEIFTLSYYFSGNGSEKLTVDRRRKQSATVNG